MGSGRLPTSKRAGIILGLGLGGLVDGVLLHQIVQWHNMGSAVVPPATIEAMRDNMRWDAPQVRQYDVAADARQVIARRSRGGFHETQEVADREGQ